MLKKNIQKEKKLSQKINIKKKDPSTLIPKKIIKKNSDIVKNDICEIVEKCDIDNISKYLIKIGKEKKFPSMNAVE